MDDRPGRGLRALPRAAPAARPHLLPGDPAAARRGNAGTCTPSTASPATPTRSSTATDDLPAAPSGRPALTRVVRAVPRRAARASRSTTRCCPAVLHTIAVFDLDRADFASFLRSMAMDLTVTAYATYDDLLDYMEGSAAVIGTMMLPILGSADPAAAREPARQLGLAFQLTNFIRDVAEDLDRGRTYLPDEDLRRVRRHPRRPRAARRPAASTPADQGPDRGTRSARARTHYAAAAPGVAMLAPGVAGLHPDRVHALRRHPRRGRRRRLRRVRPPGHGAQPPAGGGRRARPAGPRRHPGRRSPARRCGGAGLMRDRRSSCSPATCGCTTTRRWPPRAPTPSRVVPLFVLDPALAGRSPNRDRFLHQALADLREALRGRGRRPGGARRAIRSPRRSRLAGEVGAEGVALAADVSHYARRRERRLTAPSAKARAVAAAVPRADRCRPGRADARRRRPLPGLLAVPPGVDGGEVAGHSWRRRARSTLPVRRRRSASCPRRRPASRPTPRRRRRDRGPASGCAPGSGDARAYGDRHNDLAGDRHLAAQPVPPVRLSLAAGGGQRRAQAARLRRVRPAALLARLLLPGGVRVPADLARTAYRPGADRAWQPTRTASSAGPPATTGVPIVDAGMRQLRREGWMHNRARLVTASYLTKDLGHRLAPRVRRVLPLAARRRRAQQLGQLAVGRRHRQRHPAVPASSTRSARRSGYDPSGVVRRALQPESRASPPSSSRRRARSRPGGRVDEPERAGQRWVSAYPQLPPMPAHAPSCRRLRSASPASSSTSRSSSRSGPSCWTRIISATASALSSRWPSSVPPASMPCVEPGHRGRGRVQVDRRHLRLPPQWTVEHRRGRGSRPGWPGRGARSAARRAERRSPASPGRRRSGPRRPARPPAPNARSSAHGPAISSVRNRPIGRAVDPPDQLADQMAVGQRVLRRVGARRPHRGVAGQVGGEQRPVGPRLGRARGGERRAARRCAASTCRTVVPSSGNSGQCRCTGSSSPTRPRSTSIIRQAAANGLLTE